MRNINKVIVPEGALSLRDASEYLKMDKTTMLNYAKCNSQYKIPHQKTPKGYYYFFRSDLDNWKRPPKTVNIKLLTQSLEALKIIQNS
jgi:hypothetical protein